jgi:monofunctional glycosyltransferase
LALEGCQVEDSLKAESVSAEHVVDDVIHDAVAPHVPGSTLTKRGSTWPSLTKSPLLKVGPTGIATRHKTQSLMEVGNNEPQERTVSDVTGRHRHPWLRRTAIAASSIISILFFLVLAIVVFRLLNPPITPVMISEKLRGTTFARHWVPLANISPNLPLAVMASEDGRFCDHRGVDWSAVKEAIGAANDFSDFRGASTIPMQTVKNLYLWSQRSYVRKALEVPLAYLLSVLWPKQVVIETYLNIAPWGPGIVGVEAASRYYLTKARTP